MKTRARFYGPFRETMAFLCGGVEAGCRVCRSTADKEPGFHDGAVAPAPSGRKLGSRPPRGAAWEAQKMRPAAPQASEPWNRRCSHTLLKPRLFSPLPESLEPKPSKSQSGRGVSSRPLLLPVIDTCGPESQGPPPCPVGHPLPGLCPRLHTTVLPGLRPQDPCTCLGEKARALLVRALSTAAAVSPRGVCVHHVHITGARVPREPGPEAWGGERMPRTSAALSSPGSWEHLLTPHGLGTWCGRGGVSSLRKGLDGMRFSASLSLFRGDQGHRKSAVHLAFRGRAGNG